MSVKTAVLTGALALSGITATAGLIAAGPARAATVHATPVQTAYSAFVAWERHPATANLDMLITDSFRLPKRTRADIDQLAADANGAGAFPVGDDEQYVRQDLTNGYGL
jgi:hypothetical protein